MSFWSLVFCFSVWVERNSSCCNWSAPKTVNNRRYLWSISTTFAKHSECGYAYTPIVAGWTCNNTASKHFRDMIKLNCMLCHSRSVIFCLYCNCEGTDQLVHYFHHYSKYKHTRELFWTTVINMFHVIQYTSVQFVWIWTDRNIYVWVSGLPSSLTKESYRSWGKSALAYGRSWHMNLSSVFINDLRGMS